MHKIHFNALTKGPPIICQLKKKVLKKYNDSCNAVYTYRATNYTLIPLIILYKICQ